MRLYDLTEQYNDLIDMLEQDSNNEELKQMLDGIDDAFDSKAESIVKLIKSKAAEHAALKNEANRINDRAAKLAKEIDWLEHYVETEMIRSDKDKVRSSLFSISLVKNPPSVNIVDPTVIPQEYIRIKFDKTIDKRIILDQLKAGFEVPGAEIKQERRLSIR